ncbi:hypothetical protein [Streptomyces roseoverticillatus]|uniref:hypothetical protein n=1 Tax=Streptomyces roseoverticillatus TaxID=66429 RepID=UPI0005BD1BC5|nr:hypothetical protein [Streptomyces roseoverticillatus]
MTAPDEAPLPDAEQYPLTVRFRPDGTAVTGTWTSSATALEKYGRWIGTHGSTPGVTITLEAETAGVRTTAKRWAVEPGQR